VADDGTGDDERAAAALDELRRTRSGPRGSSLDSLEARSPLFAAVVDWIDARANLAMLGVALLAAAVLGAGAWFVVQGRSDPEASCGASPFSASAVIDTTLLPAAGPASTSVVEIVVHAAGAVARPGLQRLAGGSRVSDLLEAAGGPTPESDLDRLNLAAPLADGQRLYVPRLGETAPAPVSPEGGVGGSAATVDGAGAAAGPVDLNTATADQLEALPGVGPATSAAIIAHRERNGPFGSVDDLLDVRGIGPAKLEGLRDLVTAG
jgi:competence protein ComEA